MGTIAITGGAGSIGAVLVRMAQREGHRAVSVDQVANLEADQSFVLDLMDEPALESAFGDMGDLVGLA